MPEHNSESYILVSGAAVEIPGDDRQLSGWLVQKMASIALSDRDNVKAAMRCSATLNATLATMQ